MAALSCPLGAVEVAQCHIIEFFKSAKHVFTHIDWFMDCYRVKSASAAKRFLWVTPRELAETYPLPTAFKPFAKDFTERQSE